MGKFTKVPGHLIVLVLVFCPLVFGGCKNGVQWRLTEWPRALLDNSVDRVGSAY